MRSGVRSGFGCGDVLSGRGFRPEARVEQREEALATPSPPVPSERPFDELPVQVLAPEAVQDAEAPALEVREHAVDPIQNFMRRRVPDLHRPADLLNERPGRLVAPQAQMALKLQGRHPVRMRGHDVEHSVPSPQRHMRAVHERPDCHRGLLPAFRQSRHWWTQRARLSRTAFRLPQSGQTKPSGQRRRNRSSAPASSFGYIRSN